jgi:ABC-type multidrug transport system fused ATPase/permease subunit
VLIGKKKFNFMKRINEIIKDIFFVSKLTRTKNKKLRIVFSIIISNISVFCDIVIILFFADFFQNTSDLWILEFINSNLYLLPILVLIRFLAMYAEKMNILGMQLEIEKNLKEYLMDEVFSKGNYSTSDAFFYIGQLSNHVSYFYNAITTSLNLVVQIIVYLGYLLFTNFNSVSIFAIGAVVLYFPTKKLSQLLRRYVDLSYHENKKLYEDIQKLIDNLYIIKIAKKATDEISKFGEKVSNYQKYQYKNYQYGTINSILPPFITIFIFSLIIVFIEIIDFITLEFVGIVVRLFQSVGEFNKTLGMVINSHVHLEKLHMVEKNKFIVNASNFIIDEGLDEKIALRLEDVSFKYIGSENNIFENLSIEIERNKHTVITGKNGSGKSTLLGICSGVFYPDKGKTITFTKNFGYVGVIPLIFSDTLKNNLVYGTKTQVSDEEIINLVNDFKLFNESNDVDLNIEVNNKSLSSGQMQKISFIRAILSKVDILVLDESMSNLDTKTKELIYSILKKLNLTIINSTHSIENLDYDNHFEIQIDEDMRKITKQN